MKRSTFIALFIGSHLLFIILQIHKHTYITKLSYKKQELEHETDVLSKQERTLTHEWYALTNNTKVKEAAKKLGLIPLSLSQVKKIKDDAQQL